MPRQSGSLKSITAGLSIVALLAIGGVAADWWVAKPLDTHASYVGRSTCAECHQQQIDLWTGSDHDLAMDHATAKTVLGDFENATLEHHGVTSTMFRRDGQYFVNTEGPDGEMADFEVKFVFGFEPLQQYMVEFDRQPDQPANETAKLQVLRVSWDTETNEWFYLAPPDVDDKLAPDDPLHWTQVGQNWNHMCASCHSTDLKKNFDVATKTYHTTWSEIDVSCEACHGPGSVHVELANAKSLFWDRNLGYGLKRLKSDDSSIEIETCAPCHSRRRTVHPDDPPGQNYYDCFSNELLTPSTYYCDGQILDEVYVYGSFIQSKMFHKGIRCTDCHDPHTTKLKFEGNAMCVSCHDAHPAGKYDTPNHHRHEQGSAGAQCVSCHMPETPYMEVDFRRDHSLRVPRPDLSVDLGTPNACTGCHLELKNVDDAKHASLPHYAAWMNAAHEGDEQVQAEIGRVDQWAADLYAEWYPGKYGKQDHFAYTLASGWESSPLSVEALHELARLRKHASIVRATSLLDLSRLEPQRATELAEKLVADPDPQVRTAAVMAMEAAPLRQRLNTLSPLLADDVRSVRVEAARVLADAGPGALKSEDESLRQQALDEYRRGLEQNGDLAMSHMGMALLSERQQDVNGAVASYRTAIEVQPGVTGPRSNLAALYESLTRNVPPGSQQAMNARAEVARLRKEELNLMARDIGLAPDNAMLQYRYGLALYLDGRLEQAGRALQRAVLSRAAVRAVRDRASVAEGKALRESGPHSRWTERAGVRARSSSVAPSPSHGVTPEIGPQTCRRDPVP